MNISIQSSVQGLRPAEAAPAQTPSAPAPVQAGQAAAPEVKVDPQQSREELSQAIARLNEMMSKQGRDLSFSMDEQLNRTVIQVRSTSTGEVVRQIPDEVVLKVARSIDGLKGLLLNEKS